MKLLAVSDGDPDAVMTWSGIPHYALAALRKAGHEVESFTRPEHSLATRVLERVLRQSGQADRINLSSLVDSRHVAQAFHRLRADAVIGFASSGVLARLGDGIPFIHVSDATPSVMSKYYDQFTSMSPSKLHAVDSDEKRVFQRARLSSLSSTWATGSALSDYGARSENVLTNPFGACLPDPGRKSATTDDCASYFLWCGVDWQRKGGDVAVEAIAILRTLGYDARLKVVGCEPPDTARRDYIECLGFLSKSSTKDLVELQKAYKDSLALILPTRAEAFGLVFCEAAAFGRPAVAFDTGGVSSAVANGETGILLDPGCGAEAFAQAAARMIEDNSYWERLSQQARTAFEERLNWDCWAKKLIDHLQVSAV